MRSLCKKTVLGVMVGTFALLLGFAGAGEDEFDPEAALELIYGEPDSADGRLSWTHPEDPDEPMLARVLAALPFNQGGDDRMFLLAALVPLEGEFKCHVCAPGIGAATFTKTVERWRLDVATPYVMDLGSYGKAPDPDLVKVGPERHAVVFDWGGVGQGYYTGLSNYLLESETGVYEALTVETYSDNSGACDPEDEESRRCWAYRSSLEFLPGKHPEYFDLKVTTTGPGEDDFHEETLYSVTDGKYQVTRKRTLGYRMVTHPVSGAELPRITLSDRPEVARRVNDHLETLAADMMCEPDTPRTRHGTNLTPR